MTKPDSETITGKGVLTIAGTKVEVELTVPAQSVPLRKMLPVFQQLSNVMVDVAVRKIKAQGEQISCAKGCGACCRQLVPIAESEAYQLRALVEAMPEPRRTTMRARFEVAKEKLQNAGLDTKLLTPGDLSTEQRRQLGLDYFQQGIACPFLEDESCSIHAERPLACREYLVTSPAEHCAEPSAATVRCVEIPGGISALVQKLGATRPAPWLPLTLALEWAEAHPEQAPLRPGPEWLQQVLQRLAAS